MNLSSRGISTSAFGILHACEILDHTLQDWERPVGDCQGVGMRFAAPPNEGTTVKTVVED